MKPISQLISDLALNPLMIDMTYKYSNVVELSGFLLRKPKVFKHDTKNVESCSFIVYQINNTSGSVRVETFSCITYVTELIEQLKVQDKVLLVANVGKIRYSSKIGEYIQVLEMATLYELENDLVD